MPRLNSVSSYRLHKRTGQAIVTLRIAVGHFKHFYLGPYGSQDSKDKYSALIIEHRKQYPVVSLPAPDSDEDITVDDLIAAYLIRCEGYYRHADCRQTSEFKGIIGAMKPLHSLCGSCSQANSARKSWSRYGKL